ncbi:S-formylglutathione hydrolase FrmB [Motilibacter rhizosphaerae]|uniref:S-formylglutathione hydrolase FrmB n=1 Tax=Motilibacter rhizosphaerae TaxID=598652 RepID=A0A4Q7NTE1_9ACTN|nr:alpha/beta hydrolase-fold protein [Motilibacter rhizosphaerae]RZS90274.1 S-formylglutathione hydrolase FrmB [Motilibacter rhizosphaerae]
MLPELIGLPLVVLLVVLALAAALGGALLWPRLARTGPLTVLARVGVLVLCQVTAVALLADLVNRQYAFFTSWDDLLGRPPAEAVAGHLPVPEHYRVGVLPLAQAQVHGELLDEALPGATTHLTGAAYVYLPPEYFSPRWAGVRFPVAVWLAGYPGSGDTIVQHLDLVQAMQTEVDLHHAQPMVLVMMSPTLAPPRDTECADVPHGPQVRTYFERDLPQLLESRYRVARARTGWAVDGISTGGFCAATLLLHDPQRYATGVSVSGYYSALLDGTTGALYAGSQALRDDNDPLWLLAHRPAPPVALLITASRQEKEVYAQSLALLRAARAPMTVDARFVQSGGHNYTVFRAEVPAVLDWLSARLQPETDEPVAVRSTTGAPRHSRPGGRPRTAVVRSSPRAAPGR